MCGRYTLYTPQAELVERFGADPDRPLARRYNCSPGQRLPVITSDDPDRMQFFTWGLTPSWADDERALINARSETVRRKRSFADAYESRRCLVPADGFYEWTDLGEGKRPYRVAFEDDRPFAMAGLWERWRPPTRQTGLGEFGSDDADETSPLETFTVVTTRPNELISTLHHRMAVILDPADERRWLRGDPDDLAALLEPYPDDDLHYYPVSDRVNDPTNDDPALIEPLPS